MCIRDRHTPDRCVINQREIGTDTESYADALRAVLREDPDVILICLLYTSRCV